MIGVFSRTDTDVIVEATLNANREMQEEEAINRFLTTLEEGGSKVIEHLRNTYRTTVDELCEQCGIVEGEARRSIHRQMYAAFPRNLRLTVREYLRDQRVFTAITALHRRANRRSVTRAHVPHGGRRRSLLGRVGTA